MILKYEAAMCAQIVLLREAPAKLASRVPGTSLKPSS